MQERGSVTIWGIGLLIVVIGFAGLAIDTWRVFAERQAIAGLADSASIAGANGIDVARFRDSGTVLLDRDEAERRALGYLTAHGGSVARDLDVIIRFPGDGIEVTLGRQVELTLLSLFLGGQTVDLRASAFAAPGEHGGS